MISMIGEYARHEKKKGPDEILRRNFGLLMNFDLRHIGISYRLIFMTLREFP